MFSFEVPTIICSQTPPSFLLHKSVEEQQKPSIFPYYECEGLEISNSPKYENMVLDIYRLFFDPLIIYPVLIIRWNPSGYTVLN